MRLIQVSLTNGEDDPFASEDVSQHQLQLLIDNCFFHAKGFHCRNKRVDTLYMHCLSRNARMMRIAKKAGMEINFAYGEADGYLSLPPADTHSMLSEMMQDQVAAIDYAVKRQLRNARRLFSALLPSQRAA